MKAQIKAALKSNKGQPIAIKQTIDDESLLVDFYQQSTWERKYLIDKIDQDIYRDVINVVTSGEDVDAYLLSRLKYLDWQKLDNDFKSYIAKNIVN